MTSQNRKVWRYHLDNLQALELNFTLTTRACKEYVRRERSGEARILLCNAAFSLGALAECKLATIAFYPIAGHRLQADILNGTVEEAWMALVDEGFAKKYQIPVRDVPKRINFTDAARRRELLDVIADYVSPMILLRNALAHGQWVYGMTEGRDRISPDKMKELSSLGLWGIIIRKNLFDKFASIVESLVITRGAFDRDFDKMIDDLHAAKGRLINGDGKKWERMLQERWARRPSLSPDGSP